MNRIHGFAPASRAEIEAAIHPFIDRFLPKWRRERAMVLFSGRHRGDAMDLISPLDRNGLVDYKDEQKAIAGIDRSQRGIFMKENGRAFRVDFGQFCDVSWDDNAELFIADNGMFAVIVSSDMDPWLVTRYSNA